ncbi:FHA domain-containing protein [Colletotrichum sublineola]|nr:FHA domain-containing protein [Colletotrichum sublineola]
MSSSSPPGPRPQAHDVLVKFTVKHPRPEVHYPERRVVLEQSKTSVLVIGRSSKRFDNLEAKVDNCYFDSPVMSREHAKITIDWYHKKLNIKDIGSLHGTYRNSQRLQPRTLHELQQHDTLKFGIDIQRSNELFPPCTVEVEWEWDNLVKTTQTSTQINPRPSFAVPDDSDSSDCDDDGITESDVRDTALKIRNIDMPKWTANPGRFRCFPSSIDLTMDSPMNEPETNEEMNGDIAPIVLDEDSQEPSQEPVGSPLITPQCEGAVADLNVHQEAEEVLPSSLDGHRQHPPVSPSDSESDESDDESYDDESSSYPDELPSSYDELLGSCDEDINLSASDSEDISEDDDDEEEEPELEIENGSNMESESERLEVPSYEPDHSMADDYDCESVAEQPDSTLWADEGTSYMCSQSLPEVNSLHQSCYISSTWQPEQPSVQGALSRPLRPMPMPALPSIAWPALPAAEHGEQGRPNDFRLPSILNPLDPPAGSLSEGSNSSQQLPAVRPTEYPAQKEVVVPSSTHWQQAYETPKPIAAAVEKGSWTLAQNEETSSEALGHLTGKPEFFAAREHNKAVIRRQEQQEDSQPEANVSQTTEVPAEVSTSVIQPIGALNRATVSESVEAHKSTNVAESVWSASGDMFLNTPQDFLLSGVRNASPELDMTSAYQFHQSKLASSQLNSDNAAQPATNEPDRNQQSTVALKSPKRKAEDISTLGPEEEAIETSKKTASEMQITSRQIPPVVPAATELVNESAPPPSKRLRSFLTKAGYFLGGGVVTAAGLVTALSAAAPTL